MDELRNFNASKMFKKLNLPDDEFEDWLKSLELLPKERTCECGGQMSHMWVPGRKYPAWRCTKKSCRKTIGYLKNTWSVSISSLSCRCLYRTHFLQVRRHAPVSEDFFQLSYYFCRQTQTYDEIMFDMQREDGTTIGAASINEWMNYYRCVIAEYFTKNPLKIGGPGVVVEIDESVITKRKYHRGALRAEEQWFFGGVERGSGRCFICPVDRRDAATLLPIIQQYILPGTIIMSDKWAAYNRIDQLPELYEHYTVNQ